MHPHGVDYTRTSYRLTWDRVPLDAVLALGKAVGAPIVSANPPVGSGFGGQYAGTVQLADDRIVFVKGAPEILEFPAASLRREAEVLPLLPTRVPHAQVPAAVERDGWVLLALEHLDGHLPGQPWTQTDLRAAYDACLRMASAAVPDGLLIDEYATLVRCDDHLLATEEALGQGCFELPTTHGRDPWLAAMTRQHGRAIAELSAPASELRGNSLCHNDLRPDNLLMTGSGAVLVDWNFVTAAPAWIDFVGLLPMAHRQGLDVTRWWATDLLAGAEHQAIDAALAAKVVYLLSRQSLPPPPGCTTAARRHHLVLAGDFMRLLAQRRGWVSVRRA